MIALLLVVLFFAVGAASAFTLADAAVRGKNAYTMLRNESRIGYDTPRIFVAVQPGRTVPAGRPVLVSSSRSALRPARTVPLRAAA